MRKNLLIGSGTIILLLLASILFQPNPEVFVDSHEKPYISLSRQEAVLNYKWKDMFAIKDNAIDTIECYQITGNPSDRVSYDLWKTEIPDVRDTSFSTVAEVLFFFTYQKGASGDNPKINEINISPLSKQNYFDRKSLFKDADNYEGRRYLDKEGQAYWEKGTNDLFSKIDDSVFIFIFISLIPFLILLFHDLILYLLKAKPFSGKYYGWQIFLLVLTILFFFNMVTPPSYAADKLTALLKYILLFSSIYFIYQYLIKGILKDEQAYKKAIILFALCILCVLASTLLARLIDTYAFGSDGYTMLAQRPIYFELGFMFSFVLGNFFNNLRKSYFAHRRKSKELDSTKIKALASEAELNSIQASVNPHFLYNSLNSIASLAESDPAKTEAMAIALSKFYKYQTNREGEPLSSLTEELDMIKSYLAIEEIRFGNRLQYKVEIDEQSKSKKIPHFMLQPLIENAVKYGYNEQSEKITILLSVKSIGNALVINLFDNGKIFSEDLDSGYGLKSVMKKLQLFYPDSHTIDFVNAPKKHVAIKIQNI